MWLEWVDAVEKVGYEAAAALVGIFSRGRCAIRNRPSAPESRLSEVSCGSRYPLVSTICNRGLERKKIQHVIAEGLFQQHRPNPDVRYVDSRSRSRLWGRQKLLSKAEGQARRENASREGRCKVKTEPEK